MSRTKALNAALTELQSSSADIEACAIVSNDGLIIASSLPQSVQEVQVAAMSAAMLSMGARTSAELKRGRLEQLFVRGEHGYIVIVQAGPDAVLLAMARKDAKLGLIFFEVARTAEQVRQSLS